MRSLLLVLCLAAVFNVDPAWAGRRGGFVKGYVTRTGKVVSPHHRGPSVGPSFKVKSPRAVMKQLLRSR